MNSKGLKVALSELSGLPEYKVAAMFTFMVRVIKEETKKGGVVDVPLLGTFRGKVMKAKTMKNVRDGGGTKTMNLPARRKLVFVPNDSVLFIER